MSQGQKHEKGDGTGSQRQTLEGEGTQSAVQPRRVLEKQASRRPKHGMNGSNFTEHPKSALPSSMISSQITQHNTRVPSREMVCPLGIAQPSRLNQLSPLQSYPSPTTSASESPLRSPGNARFGQLNPNSFIAIFPPSAQRSDAACSPNALVASFPNSLGQILENSPEGQLLPNASHAGSYAHPLYHFSSPYMGLMEDALEDTRKQTSQLQIEMTVQPFRQPLSQPHFISAANPGFNSTWNHPSQSTAPLLSHSQIPFSRSTVSQPEASSFSIAALPSIQGVSGFRPSHMLLESKGIIPSRRQLQAGPGPCYLGDTNSKSYLSVIHDLPPHENSALWVTNIPLTAKHMHLFDLIHEGPVWALHLCKPTDTHPTQAAKLIFTTPQAAGNFYIRANTGLGIQVHGTTLKVMYNRDGHRARIGLETRVLLIEGPREIMNFQFWEAQFSDACIFQLDRWQYLPSPDPERPRMEIRFARVDGQCQTCKQKISMEPEFAKCVTAQYGLDPCDPSIQYILQAQAQAQAQAQH